MKVRFYRDECGGEFETIELNREGIAYMYKVADERSEDYSNYVVSVYYDEQGIFFYLDGPWEC